MFNSSHRYSLAMNIGDMHQWCKETAHVLARLCRESEVLPIFCYRGLSGTATATALAMYYHTEINDDFGQIYVRKSGEKCYGRSEYEYNLGKFGKTKIGIIVFVDDLLETGTTRNACVIQALAALTELGVLHSRTSHIEVLSQPNSVTLCSTPSSWKV